MDDGAPGERRYPSGCKPWGTPAEYSELDGVWSVASGTVCNFIVGISSDTPRRDAMAMVHHQFTLMHKQLFLEALQEHIACLRPLVTKQAFFVLTEPVTSNSTLLQVWVWRMLFGRFLTLN